MQAQFESLAIEPTTKQEMLAAPKGKLARRRSTMPLFNTRQYARHLERAYHGLSEPSYPFRDRDVIIAACGRLCL